MNPPNVSLPPARYFQSTVPFKTMLSQSEFLILDRVPEAASDGSACYLHGLENSYCLFPDESFLGEQRSPSLPDDRIWYDDDAEQSCALAMPAMTDLSMLRMDCPNAAVVVGHADCVQSAANDYEISQYHCPNPGSDTPAQSIPSVTPVQATEATGPASHPALDQGNLESFGGGASAVVTSTNSVGSFATASMASFPSEVSHTHPFPVQFANSGPPQQSFDDLRPCLWEDDQGGRCGELVGRDCQDHLASAHGILKISARTRIRCGACGKVGLRKFILRHYRERHLRFPRSKRNAA